MKLLRSRLGATLATLVTAGSVMLGAAAAYAQPAASGVSEEVRRHVMRPAHVMNIRTDDGRGAEPATVSLQRTTPPPAGLATGAPMTPHLDVTKFGEAFHKALKDSVSGYAMQLRQNGTPVYTLIWNWAQTPSDKHEGWKLDTRMHIASVSKMMTGIGMTRLLDAKGISYDAKIIDYMPTYWTKGPHVNQITFRQLLTHTSGFNTGTSSSDFEFMKDQVEKGVSAVGGYAYQNMNFGLCRILIAVINGNVNKHDTHTFWNDTKWDHDTIAAYKAYLQNHVFTPAGVHNATFDHQEWTALAYPFPVNGRSGWNSGDLSSVSGGAGWHFSVNEVLNVMGTFRRAGTIMSTAKAQSLLDNMFGIDQVISTPAGKLYDKNGLWQDGNGDKEQSVAYYMPDNMELVAFVNSPIGAGASLRGLVKTTYIDSLR